MTRSVRDSVSNYSIVNDSSDYAKRQTSRCFLRSNSLLEINDISSCSIVLFASFEVKLFRDHAINISSVDLSRIFYWLRSLKKYFFNWLVDQSKDVWRNISPIQIIAFIRSVGTKRTSAANSCRVLLAPGCELLTQFAPSTSNVPVE